MRFLCDEMLNRLGHWLRAAGYDTLIAEPGRRDGDLLHQARQDRRLLITRDTKIMEHKHAAETVILLAQNGVDECALELATKLPINWLYRPFSRCMECNTPLVLATPKQQQRTPHDTRNRGYNIYYCPACDQVFWPGSHVTRMRHKLNTWNSQHSRQRVD